MADIAFLLLLFFLVATTISQEKGIVRKLPDPCPTTGEDCNANIHKRNVLNISINEKGELLVAKDITKLSELKDRAKQFLDNNASGVCEYCEGAQDPTASDHPNKAVISLSSHRLSSYARFIAVQDELTKAYKELRSDYAAEKFGKSLRELSDTEVKEVQKAYPFKVSEASVK